MRTMIDKALLIALGAMLAAMMRGFGTDAGVASVSLGAAANATLIAGLLVAMCAAGLDEWLMGSRGAWLPPALYAAAALILPAWTVFLPSIAYDAARVRSAHMEDPSRRTHGPSSAALSGKLPTLACLVAELAACWAWLVPTGAMLMRPSGLTAVNVTVAFAACIGFLFGYRAGEASRVRSELRSFEDRVRASVRSSRARLADLTEERDRSARTATLAERTRIAREIHDNVGHLLTRAIMQTGAGKAVADATGDTVASQEFAGLAATLDDAMTMVRRSVHDLEDEGTDFAARMADAVRSFDGVTPGFAVALTNDVAAAPAPVARCFATVIREALANVVHHSNADGANVTLRDFPAFWQLVIRDDGPAKVEGKAMHSDGDTGGLPRGMGLADIEARVRALDGTAVCGPYAGGWRVFVSIPKGQWSASTVRSDEAQGSPAGR